MTFTNFTSKSGTCANTSKTEISKQIKMEDNQKSPITIKSEDDDNCYESLLNVEVIIDEDIKNKSNTGTKVKSHQVRDKPKKRLKRVENEDTPLQRLMKSKISIDEHFKQILLFYFRKGTNVTEAHKEICDVYGVDCITESTCQNWFKKFNAGDFS